MTPKQIGAAVRKARGDRSIRSVAESLRRIDPKRGRPRTPGMAYRR